MILIEQLLLWYCLSTLVVLVIVFHVRRAARRLQVKNACLRGQNEIMTGVLRVIGGHSVALLVSQERFGTGGRTTVPGKGVNDYDLC